MSQKIWKVTIVEDLHEMGRKPGELPKRPGDKIDLQAEPRKFLFFTKLVPRELLGTVKEKAETKACRLQVNIAPSRLPGWRMHDAESVSKVAKVALGIGMINLKEWMESGGVPEKLPVIEVDSKKYGDQCPVDPSSLQAPVVGAEFDLKIEPWIGF